MRKVKFVEGEYYHIYNRGVDKRLIFGDQSDADRFLQSIIEFNVLDPIGSIYENSFREEKTSNDKLVGIVAYCLNPNHYHFLLTPKVSEGIEKFMHRLGNGYTKYFNNKYKRSGSLFQGRFKSSHIDTNEYLLHLSAYINLNYLVHKIPPNHSLRLFHSFDEYQREESSGLCEKEIILQQFRDNKDYVNFAKASLKDILDRKESDKMLRGILID